MQLKRYKYKTTKLLLAGAIDRLARPFFTLLRTFRRRRLEASPPRRPSRILVLQTGVVGDVVMSLPALRTLRHRFPNAKITLVAGAWANAILAHEGVVDETLNLRAPWVARSTLWERMRFWSSALTLRRLRYDLGLDLRGDPRSLLFLYLTAAVERVSYGWYGAQLGEYLLTRVVPGPALDAHLVDVFLAVVTALGGDAESHTPQIHLAPHEQLAALAWRRGVLADSGGSAVVGIHPGAANPLRRWSVERFATLITRLVSLRGVSVVVFAGPGEEAIATDIVQRVGGTALLQQLPLREFIIRVSALDVLVALDSSPGHIGAALGVPVVSLFGPAVPTYVGPIGPAVRIVQEGVFECRPCTQQRCVHPEASCMDAIGVDAVLRATTESLSTRSRRDQAGVPT